MKNVGCEEKSRKEGGGAYSRAGWTKNTVNTILVSGRGGVSRAPEEGAKGRKTVRDSARFDGGETSKSNEEVWAKERRSGERGNK